MPAKFGLAGILGVTVILAGGGVVMVVVPGGLFNLTSRVGQSSVPVVLSLCLSTCKMKRFGKCHPLLLLNLTLPFPSR